MINNYILEAWIRENLGWNDCDITFKWDRGHAEVHMLEFFPCEQSRLKKFMKLFIEQDWNNREAHYEKVEQFLESCIQCDESQKKEKDLKHAELHSEWLTLTYKINDLKAVMQVTNDKEELKKMKDDLKNTKVLLKSCKIKINDVKQESAEIFREISYLERNLETIKQRK